MKLLCHFTQFFRDPETLLSLQEQVFPKLQSPLIWIPGCSTGEEPYSLAIALLEFFGKEALWSIVATDIDKEVVKTASRGCFSKSVSRTIPPNQLRCYFTAVGSELCISVKLQQRCLFFVHDLLQGPPPLNMDLVVCRNVLVHFEKEEKRKALQVIQSSLRSGGFLVLACSESKELPKGFRIINHKHRIFQKE